jgi:hypothetical protein
MDVTIEPAEPEVNGIKGLNINSLPRLLQLLVEVRWGQKSVLRKIRNFYV